MRGALLGPAFDQHAVATWLSGLGVPHTVVSDDDELHDTVAASLAAGEVVGWFSGAMEFGPRALGNRSILADPRDPAMVARLNRLTKGREGFRPFAPSVLAEEAASWFETDVPMPYMLFTAQVRGFEPPANGPDGSSFADRLAGTRSPIPACTHVDGSARVQTVDRHTNPVFHGLLVAFQRRTGCPVLLNTSFNRADEPIVCTPQDAFRTFLDAGLDTLAIEGVIVRRKEVPE
jgi:carbamoyltransferase